MKERVIKDNRMFDEKLYCEGREKPLFRGKLHGLAVLFLVPVYFSLIYSHLDAFREFLAVLVFFFGTLFCWTFSYMFHCGRWSVSGEIFIQRIGLINTYIHTESILKFCYLH